jgi:hypothetical protein
VIFDAIVVLGVLGGGWWFSRTSLFRAHLHGHGKDPGDAGTRVEGRFPRNGGDYYYTGRDE